VLAQKRETNVATNYRKKDVDIASITGDIHYIAEEFLKDPWARHANTFTTSSLIEADTYVVLVRATTPKYFYGYKRSSRTPVFTHDLKLAKRILDVESHTWQDSLASDGVVVETRRV
jgi:hypothetical protein